MTFQAPQAQASMNCVPGKVHDPIELKTAKNVNKISEVAEVGG